MKITYFDCWISVATTLFSQALAGEPELVESPPRPMETGSVGFIATLSGEHAGRFSMTLDAGIFQSPLVGEGVDQKAGWSELLREVCDAAAGDMLARSGVKCRVESFDCVDGGPKPAKSFELRSSGRSWSILIGDEVRSQEAALPGEQPLPAGTTGTSPAPGGPAGDTSLTGVSVGVELLLDVELEATLRFGCREMPLGEILELGPGDVVQLDRHVTDPVDLIVGDKIVARGEVVLVNGNFGLRVTEVAAPRKRLESIRCLF